MGMETAATPQPGPKAAPGVTRGKVAELASQGYGTRAIAERLGISTQAVWQHLKALKEAS